MSESEPGWKQLYLRCGSWHVSDTYSTISKLSSHIPWRKSKDNTKQAASNKTSHTWTTWLSSTILSCWRRLLPTSWNIKPHQETKGNISHGFQCVCFGASGLSRDNCLPLWGVLMWRHWWWVPGKHTLITHEQLMMVTGNRRIQFMHRSWSQWQMLPLCPRVRLSSRLHKRLPLTLQDPADARQVWAAQWLHRKWSTCIDHYSSY